MDAPTVNGLLVARGLLERAAAVRDGTAPGEITALILLDLAVESGAKALLGGRVQKGANFQATIKALNAWYREQADQDERDLDGTARVLELRDYRNGVQHAGNVPAPENVDRYTVHAADFLDDATTALLGVSLSSLSRSSLRDEGAVRSTLEQAEKALADADAQALARHAAAAFGMVLRSFRDRQPWRRRGNLEQYGIRTAVDRLAPPRISSSLASKLRGALTGLGSSRGLSSHEAGQIADAALRPGIGQTRDLLHVLQGMVTEVGYLSERVEAATLVADAAEHAWFAARVGLATPILGSSEFSYVPPEPPLAEQEMQRALTFVLDTAIREQQLSRSPALVDGSSGRAAGVGAVHEIVALARADEHGRVTIDDIVDGIDDPSPERVEPAISELIEEGRLRQQAAELFVLAED